MSVDTIRVAVVWLGRISIDTGGRTYLKEILRPLGAEPGLAVDVHVGDPDFDVPDTCRAVLHRVPAAAGPYGRIAVEPIVGARLARANYDVLLAPFHVVPPNWRGPTVIVLHNVLAFGKPARAELPLHKALYRERTLRSALRRASVALAVSEHLRTLVLAHYPQLDPARIEVVPYGVDERFFYRNNAPAEPSDRVLVVSALWPYKRVDQAIEAFATAARDLPNARLQIAGPASEPLRAPLEQLAARLGVASRVEFMGHVSHDRIPELYRNAGALLHLSEIEALPQPVLEAMAAGVPVIAKPIGGIKEAGGDVAVWVSPSATSATIGAELRRVLIDTEVRRRLAEAGVRRAAEFTWVRSAACTARALRRAAGRRTG